MNLCMMITDWHGVQAFNGGSGSFYGFGLRISLTVEKQNASPRAFCPSFFILGAICGSADAFSHCEAREERALTGGGLRKMRRWDDGFLSTCQQCIEGTVDAANEKGMTFVASSIIVCLLVRAARRGSTAWWRVHVGVVMPEMDGLLIRPQAVYAHHILHSVSR